jgi:hypothetical protein
MLVIMSTDEGVQGCKISTRDNLYSRPCINKSVDMSIVNSAHSSKL